MSDTDRSPNNSHDASRVLSKCAFYIAIDKPASIVPPTIARTITIITTEDTTFLVLLSLKLNIPYHLFLFFHTVR